MKLTVTGLTHHLVDDVHARVLLEPSGDGFAEIFPLSGLCGRKDFHSVESIVSTHTHTITGTFYQKTQIWGGVRRPLAPKTAKIVPQWGAQTVLRTGARGFAWTPGFDAVSASRMSRLISR